MSVHPKSYQNPNLPVATTSKDNITSSTTRKNVQCAAKKSDGLFYYQKQNGMMFTLN